MFPRFHIVRSDSGEVLGLVTATTIDNEKWVGDGWIGYLMAEMKPVSGRWHVRGDFWAFVPDDHSAIQVLRPDTECVVLDGYWGERAELVLDPDRKWQMARHEGDHDHCAVLLGDAWSRRSPGRLRQRRRDLDLLPMLRSVCPAAVIGLHSAAEPTVAIALQAHRIGNNCLNIAISLNAVLSAIACYRQSSRSGGSFVAMSEAITTLGAFADFFVAQLPSEPCKCEVPGSRWEPHFAFSRQNLPVPPCLLRTDDIIVVRTEHRYGNNVIIDVVNFYASGSTYRQLAILILAALFSEGCERAELELSNRQSPIRRVGIHTGGFNKLCWGYQVRPERFTYHPQIPGRWPQNWKLEERDLPTFDLDFVEGQPRHPINDRDKRDRLEIRGQDVGLMVLAELFLNIGLPVCSQNATKGPIPPDMTYVLESFPGHRRVHPWSAEAQFHLPGSFSWPGEYPNI